MEKIQLRTIESWMNHHPGKFLLAISAIAFGVACVGLQFVPCTNGVGFYC